MSDAAWGALRRQLKSGGGRPAWHSAEAVVARNEVPRVQIADVVEAPLRAIPCGELTPWEGSVAFLDGIQRTATIGSFGTEPVMAGQIAAGVRLRAAHRLVGATHRIRRVVAGTVGALGALGPLPTGWQALEISDESGPHPLALRDAARTAIENARTSLEREVARSFRTQHPTTWLLVDGSLTVSPDWATDMRMIGLVKSHTTLPFSGPDLERYLSLPVGHRSSVYQPATRSVTPIHTFGLRLWAPEGHDLFHGLLRVERAPSDETLSTSDLIAARLFAERVPIANDPRSDRLLYGIHAVEKWLGALL